MTEKDTNADRADRERRSGQDRRKEDKPVDNDRRKKTDDRRNG